MVKSLDEYTAEEIVNLPPGKEIDLLIEHYIEETTGAEWPRWHYSVDITAAQSVMSRMYRKTEVIIRRGPDMLLIVRVGDKAVMCKEPQPGTQRKDALTMCRAALLWLHGEETKFANTP